MSEHLAQATDETAYNHWLASITGMTHARASELLSFFESPQAVYHATDRLLQATGLNLVQQVIAAKTLDPIEALQAVQAKNICVSTCWDGDYPPQLHNIHNPPAVLYLQGRLTFADLHHEGNQVAMVGSRQCSQYGITTTVGVAKHLAGQGVTVISGMARGIDTYAHKGVLEVDGITMGVLGNGVDICYPKENAQLYERIQQRGAILSEYPPGMEARPFHFPMRNRIISGLCQATVVIEAGLKSGSLITADCALEQGKDVYAVPGPITSKLSAGTNNLIKQGAYLLTDPREILGEVMLAQYQTQSKTDTPKKQPQPKPKTEPPLDTPPQIVHNLSPDEQNIYLAVSANGTEFDQLLLSTGLDLQQLNYQLMMLELKGLIVKQAGNNYKRSTPC